MIQPRLQLLPLFQKQAEVHGRQFDPLQKGEIMSSPKCVICALVNRYCKISDIAEMHDDWGGGP